MSFAFFETRSQASTAEDQVVPSRPQIESEIAKLKEDSARDVERQLAEQRLATKEYKVEEDVTKAAEGVEEGFAPVWRAAKQKAETIVKDADVDVKSTIPRGRVETVQGE